MGYVISPVVASGGAVMLELSSEALDFRRQCIAEFGGDTLDRIILRLRCEECSFRGESSTLIATSGFGFESMTRLRKAVVSLVSESLLDQSCPRCGDEDVSLEKLYYLAFSEELGADLVADFDPPALADGRWLMGAFLNGERIERISLADSRLRAVFRESLLRAAASAAEFGGRPGLAEGLIQRSISLFGQVPRDRYLLAAVRRDAGDYEAALALLTELVNQPEQMFKALFEIGLVHFAALRGGADCFTEAFKAFSSIIELRRGDAPAQLQLGLLFLEVERFTDSIWHFKEALKDEPDSLEAQINVGVAFSKLEDHESALCHFERASDVAPGDPEVLAHLARSLELLGRSEEAAEMRGRGEEPAREGRDREARLDDSQPSSESED